MEGERVTQLLQEWGAGDRAALDRLVPLVFDELRRLAHSYLRRERAGHTLQPTALVNEAYLRLAAPRRVVWHDRRTAARRSSGRSRHSTCRIRTVRLALAPRRRLAHRNSQSLAVRCSISRSAVLHCSAVGRFLTLTHFLRP